MKIQILVRLKPGVLDVQGKAVEKGLSGLGLEQVADVRVGRLVEMDVPASTLEEATKLVEGACDKLLSNPIIETFEIKAA